MWTVGPNKIWDARYTWTNAWRSDIELLKDAQIIWKSRNKKQVKRSIDMEFDVCGGTVLHNIFRECYMPEITQKWRIGKGDSLQFFAEECEVDKQSLNADTDVIADLEGDSLMFSELLEIFKKSTTSL